MRYLLALTDLFCGTTASLDAGAGRAEERTGGTDESEDSGWIFWRVGAADLRVKRVGDAKEESEA